MIARTISKPLTNQTNDWSTNQTNKLIKSTIDQLNHQPIKLTTNQEYLFGKAKRNRTFNQTIIQTNTKTITITISITDNTR